KSVEIVPRKTNGFQDVEKDVDLIADVAHAITTPENPLGSPGIDPVISTFLATESRNLIPIPHITPRDKNIIHIHSQVITAVKLGIRNFFVVGGDPINPKYNSKEVRELDTLGLIRTVGASVSLMKENGQRIAIGAALNPFRPGEESVLAAKIQSGSTFFISQAIFSGDPLEKEWITKRSFRLIAGFIPIWKKGQLDSVRRMGSQIPDKFIEGIERAEDPAAFSSRAIREIIDEIRGHVDGIHIMPIGNVKLAREILECV
ncbi:MAG: methylenetetrahydrofolate reductase, partial [Thermoplasmataceae archaeon]